VVFEYLRGLEEHAREVLPVLVTCLTSTNSEIRYQSVRTIEMIGPGAASATDSLKMRLLDKSEMVQSAARRALIAVQGIKTQSN
jgi:HEAT repeat protein